MNLEDIAQKEEFILFDTSVSNIRDISFRHILRKNRYCDMKKVHIKNVEEDILRMINFIDLDKNGVCSDISTIEGVFKEIYRLEERLNERRYCLDEEKKRKVKLKKISNSNQKEYCKLLEVIHVLTTKLEEKEIKLQDKHAYHNISTLVLKINKKLNLTKNPKFCDVYEQFRKNPKGYLKTDENLVATLFYLSTKENKSYALITKDWGIFRLARKLHKFIWLDDFCSDSIEKLYKNPAKVYIQDPYNLNYQLRFTSKNYYKYENLRMEIKELNEFKKEGFELLNF